MNKFQNIAIATAMAITTLNAEVEQKWFNDFDVSAKIEYLKFDNECKKFIEESPDLKTAHKRFDECVSKSQKEND